MFFLPNLLSLSRIALALAAAYAALKTNWCGAAILFGIAAITDFLDGFVARRYNLETKLGKLLDPLADKVAIITLLLVLYLKGDGIKPPLPLMIAVLTKELLTVVGSMFLLKGGKIPTPNLFGKTVVAMLFLYLSGSLLFLCGLKIPLFPIRVLGYFLTFGVVVVGIIYATVFLKIRRLSTTPH